MIQNSKNRGGASTSHMHTWHASNTLNKKFIYIGVLVLTVFVICLSTNDTSMIIEVLFQYHEPSIRIFRSLIEISLLLLCTSVSIRVYIQYISSNVVQALLFQSIHTDPILIQQHHHRTEEDDSVNDDDDERARRNGDDHTLFQPVIDNDDDDNDRDMNYYDDRHNGEKNAIDINDSWQNDTATTALNTSTIVLHPLSTLILSMACDLFIYTCITLTFYLLSAIHTLQSSSSSSLSWTTTTATTTTSKDTASFDYQPQNVYVWMAKIAAPTFPLLLFLFLTVRCLQYYQQYKAFYTLLSYTIYAPLYNVTFRDGMIGDILTSMVRPMQDVAFTICYILFGLRGYWSDHQHDYYAYIQHAPTIQNVTLSMTIPNIVSNDSSNVTASLGNAWLQSADAYVPSMERSWIVHTAILPACMISPLWWRFLQTIRQSYDYEQRWPYLGNSMKYFLAAQVAMLGVYHPSVRQSTVWIFSFVVATLYQIYWDVFMDWGLLVRNRKTSMWTLRSQRLFPRKFFYWTLLIINTILRFCWTLSFVPFHYLSASGVLTNNFSNEAWANVLIFTIASAEIIRRALWGLIRVEWEAIKVKNEMSNSENDDQHQEMEMAPMKVIDPTESGGGGPYGSLHRYQLPFTSDMSSMNKIQIFGELCLYTTTFALLGLIIAAHRGTL